MVGHFSIEIKREIGHIDKAGPMKDVIFALASACAIRVQAIRLRLRDRQL
jgi:hypothetical protein